MSKLQRLWDYMNGQARAILSIVAVVLVLVLSPIAVWQFFVRGAPFICDDIWLPSSEEVCSGNGPAPPTNAGPPIGAILPFFGTDDDIPENWIICDGRNVPANSPISMDANANKGGKQLPDLRNRFVRGAAKKLDNEGIFTGGSDTTNLNHSHHWANKRGRNWYSYESESGELQRVDSWQDGISNDGSGTYPLDSERHLELFTDTQGNADADNRPAFVELRYIIRVR